MKLNKLSIKKCSDKLAEDLCNLYNKHVLRINEDDLNPNVPLSTDYEWRKNRNAGENYALLGLGMGLASVASMVGGVKEVAEMVYHFGDLGAMVNDFGMELQYCMLCSISSSLAEKSADNIKIFQQKRQFADSFLDSIYPK